MSDGIVIAGGGLAAQRCTETLRSQGYDGPIRIVCAEPHAPYDRPPLSKELLTGALPAPGETLSAGGWTVVNMISLPMIALALGAVLWLMLRRRGLPARVA